MIGIYMIKNKVNNMVYIGSSVDIEDRFKMHKWSLNNKNASNLCNDHLYKAWNKYGEDNFEFIILELCNEEQLIDREKFWLSKYGGYKSNKNYNLKEPGVRGKVTEYTKLKQSQSLKGKNKGKVRTDEVKSRIRESCRGINSKLNIETVKLIKSKIRNGERVVDISKELNINVSTVRNIQLNKTWKYVE